MTIAAVPAAIRLKADPTYELCGLSAISAGSALIVLTGVGSGFIRTWRSRMPFALGKALDDDIEDGDKSEIEERGREHAPGDGGPDRMPRAAAGAARKHERHHPEDEGE